MTDKQPAYDPYEAEMTYVEKLDFREQAHRHEMERLRVSEAEQTKRAKYRLREERQDTYRWLGIGFFVLVLLLAVIAWIYFSTAGDPNPQPDQEDQREQACVQNGGGWVPKDLLDMSDHGLCVYPGQKAEAPASK